MELVSLYLPGQQHATVKNMMFLLKRGYLPP